jgi:hypothetical protein
MRAVFVLGLAANLATCFVPHRKTSLHSRKLPLASTTTPTLEQVCSAMILVIM